MTLLLKSVWCQPHFIACNFSQCYLDVSELQALAKGADCWAMRSGSVEWRTWRVAGELSFDSASGWLSALCLQQAFPSLPSLTEKTPLAKISHGSLAPNRASTGTGRLKGSLCIMVSSTLKGRHSEYSQSSKDLCLCVSPLLWLPESRSSTPNP